MSAEGSDRVGAVPREHGPAGFDALLSQAPAIHQGFRTERPRPSDSMAPPRAPRVQAQCGALPFLIQRDGTWLYRGSPIRRKPLVCLFSSVLVRDEAGTYWLETPVERGSIEVEDVPFVAVELDWQGTGRSQTLSFRTNIDEIICAGPDHALTVDWERPRCAEGHGPAPYLHVRGQGAAAIQARVSRAVYYELAAISVPGHCHGRDCVGVWSRGVFFPIGPLTPDDQ